MANLVPPSAKKVIHREYWLRTGTVWAFLISAGLFIFAILLVPTYVLLSLEMRALLLEEGSATRAQSAEYQTAIAAVEEANLFARQLRVRGEVLLPTDILAALEAAETPAITLAGFTYERTDGDVQNVIAHGTAVDRVSLAAFQEALERDPLFARADVPVSSLVNDRNLPFSVSITIATSPQE